MLKNIIITLLRLIVTILLISFVGGIIRAAIGKILVYVGKSKEAVQLFRNDTLLSSFLSFIPFGIVIYLLFLVFRKIVSPQKQMLNGILTGLLSSILLYILANTLTITRPGITLGISIGCLCVLLMGLVSPYLYSISKKIFK
jgi:hypothetical protein